jgi:hypothetical protein
MIKAFGALAAGNSDRLQLFCFPLITATGIGTSNYLHNFFTSKLMI